MGIRVRGRIRVRRYEEKVRRGSAREIVKECWKEKKEYGWKDEYGREHKKYYNINGGIEVREVKEGGGKPGSRNNK